jgi:hypothetical protein
MFSITYRKKPGGDQPPGWSFYPRHDGASIIIAHNSARFRSSLISILIIVTSFP